ncbi:aromatic motif membrane protein [Mycoplasma mycoides]|uniref:aromatic motif membrane protein n=1 Tax=Mycoplasma mycoides TaxID=2102 RepID=UPI00223FFD1A|nr:aromatic motif membrane protein [Mycoplasma mycoides]QVK06788.1 hypothetical protein I7642_04375 [Mycoplasma mycoides subsp. capri]
MKKNKKAILTHISIFFAIIPFIVIPFLLTVNKNDKDEVFKPVSGFNINVSINDVKENQTKEMIDVLLANTFKNHLAQQEQFIKSQTKENNIKELFLKAKELSEEYKKNQDQNSINKLFDFYSTNWLFLLNNISKFEYKALDFWKLEPVNQHSKDFLKETTKEKLLNKTFNFGDNYFNKYLLGEESKHGTNNIYYLRKDKLIFRLLISKKEPKVVIDKIILFNQSKHNTISLEVISNILHAVIHKDQVHSTFEKEIIGEYNLALLGIFLLGDNYEKE